MTTNPPRLHPQSWRDLRQLVFLHGVEDIIRAVQYLAEPKTNVVEWPIVARPVPPPGTAPYCGAVFGSCDHTRSTPDTCRHPELGCQGSCRAPHACND